MDYARPNRALDISALLEEIRDDPAIPQCSVSIGGRSYALSQILGRGSTAFSSVVYLTADRHNVVKVYPSGSRLPEYDHWVSRYYRENWIEGIPNVPAVIGEPTKLSTALGEHKIGSVAVVKEYVEGIRHEELTPDVLARIGLTLEELEAAGQPLVDHVRFLHAEARFERWLDTHEVDHSEWGTVDTGRWVYQGDLKAANFIYSKSGWVLIDP
ncbi:MAG: hypothetical protein JRH01_07630 [Deltaproteobacteria bacterium]|nr:hypothetical protein [Deltaproteobacteria bacterium]MBW2396207.1 hypothetical protein [Deltaproteobacteria bacterium]